jgi:hypothetical protein
MVSNMVDTGFSKEVLYYLKTNVRSSPSTMDDVLRIIDEPIVLKDNLNAPWGNVRVTPEQFVEGVLSMHGVDQELIGRSFNGWDTILHAIAMMDRADHLGVRCGLVHLLWDYIDKEGTSHSPSVNAFPLGDGAEVVYYSPQLRCVIDGLEEGCVVGTWKAHFDVTIWNTHCYSNEIRPREYSEVEWFMYNDNTYKTKYSKGDALPYEFKCGDFGRAIKHNASMQGLRCGFVSVKYEDTRWGIEKGLHVMNAFDTLDRGIVFVEPQALQMLFTDEPKVGDDLQDLHWNAYERYYPGLNRREDPAYDPSASNVISAVSITW